jgi:subtilisin-like proprotein convertase family protein
MTKKLSARMALLACASIASLGLVAGVSPASAKTKKKVVTRTATFNQCVSTASQIQDPVSALASAVIPVTVPKFKGQDQDGTVTALTSAGVRLTHTSDNDLTLTLVSPGGKVIPLAIGRGGAGDGYGSGATSCSGSLVLFGDGFPTPISSAGNVGDAPITGSFNGREPLNQVVGGPARGAWALLVADENLAGDDTGTLYAFSLNVTYSYKALVKKKKKKKK